MKITLRENYLPIINTERLILRDIAIGDISYSYIQWINDFETTKYLEVRFQKYTRDDIERFIKSRLADIVNVKHFGVYDNNGSRLIGNVTANIKIHHKSADISYIIGHPEANNKGYGTEAVHCVVYYLFNYCDIEQIWAGYYEGHFGSEKVLSKNGFTVQGRLKKQLIGCDNKRVDHIFVGLLKCDFKPYENLLGRLPPQIIKTV